MSFLSRGEEEEEGTVATDHWITTVYFPARLSARPRLWIIVLDYDFFKNTLPQMHQTTDSLLTSAAHAQRSPDLLLQVRPTVQQLLQDTRRKCCSTEDYKHFSKALLVEYCLLLTASAYCITELQCFPLIAQLSCRNCRRSPLVTKCWININHHLLSKQAGGCFGDFKICELLLKVTFGENLFLIIPFNGL